MRLIDADKLIQDGWRLERHGKSGEVLSCMSIADVQTAKETGCKNTEYIDLINRQRAELEELKEDYIPKLKWGLKRANEIGMSQDAEIERLKSENKILSKNADTAFQDGLNEAQDLYAAQIQDKIKSEAIKEFAERLKENIPFITSHLGNVSVMALHRTIDNLVKEMTEVSE